MRTHRYRITIFGRLGEIGHEAFGDLHIEYNGANTILVGDLDQAALYGTLNRILTLGFELLELTRLTDAVPDEAELSGKAVTHPVLAGSRGVPGP